MEIFFVFGILSVFVVFLYYFTKKRSSFPEILLYGPANSGKTRLFYMVINNQLTENLSTNTVSSLKPNSGFILNNPKQVLITDYPGSHYYYSQLITKASSSPGMIFLIDSFDKLSFKKAAEELYEIMALRDPKEILIFCNKQDLPFAKKILMIESELSTEM